LELANDLAWGPAFVVRTMQVIDFMVQVISHWLGVQFLEWSFISSRSDQH
jgi:hypothetical protein